MAKVTKTQFHKTRTGFLITAVLAFVATWLVFLRASDTGSLQQYALILVLIFFGLNRMYHVIKGV